MVTNLDRVRVRCVLGQNYCRAFQGVGTSTSAHDATWKDGKCLDGFEGDLIENSSLGIIR